MISERSLFNFVTINAILIAMSITQLYAGNNIFFVILRNLFYVNFLEYMTLNQKPFNNKEIIEKYRFEFFIDLIKSSIIEFITVYIITYNKTEKSIVCLDLLYFIPVSFLFEIVFDLQHYITHRFLHESPYFYQIHKHHHEIANTKAILTFHQNPLDLIITNSIPFYTSIYLVNKIYKITPFMFCLIENYKVFTEICGHSGKESNTVSFPQFIWLVKKLKIDLKTVDHHNHHMFLKCNYAKRFTLWDKVFNTYKKEE